MKIKKIISGQVLLFVFVRLFFINSLCFHIVVTED